MTPRTLQLCRFEQGGPEVLAWTPVHATVIGMGSQEAGFARRSPRFRSVTCLVSFSWSLIEWFGDWGAYALILMSTPAGMLRELRASTVCVVGSEM